MRQFAARMCPTAGVRYRSPRPCPKAEVLTDGLRVKPTKFSEGLMCSARHFRTLPVTPVVGPRLALANGLLLPATSRSCADFRPYIEGGPLPEGTYHPLAVRPSNGYPSLALLPNGPAQRWHATHGAPEYPRSYNH